MRRAGPLLLAAGLAACGPADKPIVLRPPPTIADSSIDGRYRGTVRLIRAAGPYCPRSGARVLEVARGTVSLSYSSGPRQRVSLTAQVAPDGRIQASDGEGTLEGQVANGRLDVTVASRQCEHRWSLARVE
jgi:hypothetical protein